jgi:hypothetical protein
MFESLVESVRKNMVSLEFERAWLGILIGDDNGGQGERHRSPLSERYVHQESEP